MKNIFEILKANYEFVLIGVGAFLLLGVFLDWKWITEPTMEDKNNLLKSLILNFFGEMGYRVFMGIVALTLIIGGFIFLKFR